MLQIFDRLIRISMQYHVLIRAYQSILDIQYKTKNAIYYNRHST